MELRSNRLLDFVVVLGFVRLLFFATGPSHFRVSVLLPFTADALLGFFLSAIIVRPQELRYRPQLSAIWDG